MKRLITFCFALGALGLLPSSRADESLSLAGRWRFELDRANAGLQEKWFERSLPGQVNLPGVLPAQGIGDEVTVATQWTGDIVDKSWFTAPKYAPYRRPGNVKVPFWLQPEKYYTGPAWYQRDIEIPQSWQGQRVVLTLERPHWETRVWLDGKPLGTNNSLSTPHQYTLGTHLAPGKHQLTIRVDNGLVVDIGVNSHSVTDHTQGNWNGMVGELSLRASGPVWLEEAQVYPDPGLQTAKVVVKIGNATGRPGKGNLMVFLRPPARGATPAATGSPMPVQVTWGAEGGRAEFTLKFGAEPVPWDEFNPQLYEVTVALDDVFGSRKRLDSQQVTFGLRQLSTQGTQFLLNGHKAFFRGTLECCIFPKTGHPPTDVESWKRIVRIAKAYGLNLIRFHSWCPPEAAFVAADQLGFYYQVEIASWANQSTTLGDGKPVDRWLYEEGERILKAYGNHPSFLLMPYGNEPGGKRHSQFLAEWVNHWKSADARRLYTSASGWPELKENQFHVSPGPRIQAWGQGLKSRINSRPPETTTDYRDYIRQRSVPVISHEIGQWCVYPNFDEMPKYTGYLKPKNFEIFRDSLQAHHLGALAHRFLLASGKLQTLCYKEEIESALRTPGMGGFELLDLHDFPGQGTALVGVLDPFWEEKGYVTAAEYSRFCNATVPLARLPKRVFTTEETLHAELEIAHFGPAPLVQAQTSWQLRNEAHQVVAAGTLPACTIAVDNGIGLGEINVGLGHLPAPARYQLVVKVAPPAGPAFENDWDLWLYPAKVDITPSPALLLVNDLSDEALATLNGGGKVLLAIPPARVRGDARGPVALGFSSIFWNTAWTRGQAPHTLGILCDPRHPALAEFPTEFHSNWQWWYLLSRAGALDLDELPSQLQPTIEVIDDWVTNRKLGLLFEAKVGSGKLLVCSIDVSSGLEQNPVARQLRHSLLRYMESGAFEPKVSLAAAQVRSLVAEKRR